jgi:hypothetical protein
VTSPADSRALRALLTDAARFDAEYRGGLSNHLPMALTALTRLGADDERLAEFAQRYAQRLHPATALEAWAAGDPWRGRFGDPLAWPAYRSLFREWIAHEGASAVLAQCLPPLMEGVAAAAFHGAIRVAYALAANHADELADGLAYWSCRWFFCGAPRQGGSEREPARVLARLDFAHELAPQPLIAQAIAAAAAHPHFDASLAPLHVNLRTTLPRLAQIASERFAAGARTQWPSCCRGSTNRSGCRHWRSMRAPPQPRGRPASRAARRCRRWPCCRGRRSWRARSPATTTM